MALLTYSSFRSETLAEPCQGLALTADEAGNTNLTSAIARLTARIEEWCNDTFESETATFELDGDGTRRLDLPKRCTAITTVKLRNAAGTLGSAQTSTVYRLHSSLYSSGSKKNGEMDWLDIVPDGAGLAGSTYSAYLWPPGAQTVQVAGTFGWTTAPADIKRALALLVWDHFKGRRGDLARAEVVSTSEQTVRYTPTDPAVGLFSGVPEVDAIVAANRRATPVYVG